MPMVGSIKNVGSFHRRLEARWKLRILSNLMGDPESFTEFHKVEESESGGPWTTWRGTTIIGVARHCVSSSVGLGTFGL